MKKLLLASVLFLPVSAYAADNSITVTNGIDVNLRSVDIGGGIQAPAHVLVNSAGTNIVGAGTTLPVSGTVAATQSGTWNITNISGTITLPTGAATAAKQPALGTAGTASADVITVQGIASMTPLLANPGTAALWGVVTQGSTTSGQSGHLIMGAVTTSAPTYTTAQTSPLSLDTGGNLRVIQNLPPNDITVGPTGLTTTTTLAVSTTGSGSTGVQLTGNASGLTFIFEATEDSTNWFAVNGFTPAGVVVAGSSANGNWVIPSSGFVQVRVRITAISGGTATFTLNSSAASVQQPVGTQGTSTNISGINGSTTLSGGTGTATGALAVGGTVATNTAITAFPLNLGAQAVSSENAAVTTARQVQLVADLVGKLIVLPYANPENFVSGVTAAMTGVTSTSLIAAPAAGLRNYVTNLICTNSHATQGTFVIVQDGSAGTTIYEGYAAAVGGGFSITFPTPLRQPTTATALFVQDVTTGANVICSGSGYKGA